VKMLHLNEIRLITHEIYIWIKHLIHQLSAHLFESIATRFTSSSSIVKTLTLLKSIFFSIRFDFFLLANILDDNIVRTMINDMKKATFSDDISIMRLDRCERWSERSHDWVSMLVWVKKILMRKFRLMILPSLNKNFWHQLWYSVMSRRFESR
jgi:hypothetical protein